MDNVALVVVLFIIVLLFASVVIAVLYWYKQQVPHAELMDDCNSSGNDQEQGKGQLLAEMKNKSLTCYVDDGGSHNNTSMAGSPGAVPKMRSDHSGARSFKDISKSRSSYSPPKRAGKSPLNTPDQHPSPGSNSIYHSTGNGNPLSFSRDNL